MKNTIPNDKASPTKKSKKAFAILGLHESDSGDTPIMPQHKRSHTYFNVANAIPITDGGECTGPDFKLRWR